MNIVLFGASGNIGRRILLEALDRGHSVSAVVRNPSKVLVHNPMLEVEKGDVLDAAQVTQLASGCDTSVSAFGPGVGNPDSRDLFMKATESLIRGTKNAGIKRLINVGGAGSLFISPGVQLVDSPQFPEALRAYASAQRDTLELFRMEKDLEWTFFCPAVVTEPGKRTGKFRLGKDKPVFDSAGESRISMEDFGVALVDEIENPHFVRERFTIGY